jgi:hypothetical protein
MAIMFSRDAQTGAYCIDDTLDPAKSRVFETRDEWLHESLVLLIEMTEKIERGLARLQALLHDAADRYATLPPPPVEIAVRDTLPTGPQP